MRSFIRYTTASTTTVVAAASTTTTTTFGRGSNSHSILSFLVLLFLPSSSSAATSASALSSISTTPFGASDCFVGPPSFLSSKVFVSNSINTDISSSCSSSHLSVQSAVPLVTTAHSISTSLRRTFSSESSCIIRNCRQRTSLWSFRTTMSTRKKNLRSSSLTTTRRRTTTTTKMGAADSNYEPPTIGSNGDDNADTNEQKSSPTSLSSSSPNKKQRTTTKSSTKGHNGGGGSGGGIPAGTNGHVAVPWFKTMFTKDDEQYFQYMANEWGFEKRGDQALFEKLSLEGAQSGLSWLTILRKREAYRRTFHNFDIDAVALMTDDDVERIVSQDGGDDPSQIVVRHRGKIQAVINNAKCIQKMRKEYEEAETASGQKALPEHGVFDQFLWSFVNDQPIVNTKWDGKNLMDAPGKSEESEAMSKALKKKGFKFVGPTTCYSLMQSFGMVIDHPVNSPEWEAAVERLKKREGGYQTR